MKKLFSFIIATCLIMPCILFSGCGKTPHTHNWSTTWSRNNSEHWLTCDGCDEKKDKGTHTLEGDVCSVCGYDTNHTCQYGESYLSDSTGHWQQCSICEGTTTKENHDGNICSVCGYNSLQVVSSIRDLEVITYQTDGHGLFTLVKLPDGKNMLIDAGGTENVDIRTFKRFVVDNGFATIDYMVLTNIFANRTGGAETILSVTQVNNLYIPDTQNITYTSVYIEPFNKAVNYASNNNCNVVALNPTNEEAHDISSSFSYNSVEYSYTIDFITPVAPADCTTELDASIYIAITYQNKVILFTGDATNKNIDNYANGDYDYNVDVLITNYHSNYGKDAIRLSQNRGTDFLDDINLTNGDHVIITNYGDITGLLTLRQVIASYGASGYSSTAFTYATVKIGAGGVVTVTTTE